jgi:hypothetical protein
LIDLSNDAETKLYPSGEKATYIIRARCPVSLTILFSVFLGYHIIIVKSSEPETRISPEASLALLYLSYAYCYID